MLRVKQSQAFQGVKIRQETKRCRFNVRRFDLTAELPFSVTISDLGLETMAALRVHQVDGDATFHYITISQQYAVTNLQKIDLLPYFERDANNNHNSTVGSGNQNLDTQTRFKTPHCLYLRTHVNNLSSAGINVFFSCEPSPSLLNLANLPRNVVYTL